MCTYTFNLRTATKVLKSVKCWSLFLSLRINLSRFMHECYLVIYVSKWDGYCIIINIQLLQ
jgi:hypothetical protein